MKTLLFDIYTSRGGLEVGSSLGSYPRLRRFKSGSRYFIGGFMIDIGSILGKVYALFSIIIFSIILFSKNKFLYYLYDFFKLENNYNEHQYKEKETFSVLVGVIIGIYSILILIAMSSSILFLILSLLPLILGSLMVLHFKLEKKIKESIFSYYLIFNIIYFFIFGWVV